MKNRVKKAKQSGERLVEHRGMGRPEESLYDRSAESQEESGTRRAWGSENRNAPGTEGTRLGRRGRGEAAPLINYNSQEAFGGRR